MTLPNFLIIGAAKAGTSSLYSWLNQHPQIYMCPIKETNFFALENQEIKFPKETIHEGYLRNFKITLTDYEKQFAEVNGEKRIGEACPSYLYYPEAPLRIKNYIPDAKLIVILRNPVTRAYSNFLHHLRDNLETTTDFKRALELENERIQNSWWWGFHYRNAGFYSVQLKRYLEIFTREQIEIYLFEDLKNSPEQTMKSIFHFLDVDDSFTPEQFNQYNVTGIPKNRFFYQFLTTKNPIKEPFKFIFPKKIRDRLVNKLKNKTLQKPELNPEIKLQLIDAYRSEILELQELIARDLSNWLE